MELKITKIPEHFYLYCALFYNNNRTIDYNDVVLEVSNTIVNTLKGMNFRKLDMAMHSYHYLMGLLNPQGYYSDGVLMKQPQEVLDYIKALSEVIQLEGIYKEQEPILNTKLSAYEEKFEYIKKHFNTYFDFKPKDTKFTLTRNWDASGKCISTESGAYIFVGWKIKGLNAKQILHEITHSFIDTCNLPIPANIENIMSKMPRYVYESYAKPKILAEESFIRALVVYLDRIEGNTFEFSFNEDDLSMLLPAKYLEKLEKDGVKVVTRSYINSFSL